MMTIHLQDLIFFAGHGVFPEEEILGGEFVVNVKVYFTPVQPLIQEISDTLNYAEIFDVVQKIMMEPTPLLETLAQKIGYQIIEKFNMAEEVFVKIDKSHPPILSFQGKVGVSSRFFRK
jgi:dihydroneopterin aldolase